MKVILVYDIATEDNKDAYRLNKVRKVVKKYLTHVQKSVFEGEITEAKLEKLKYELKNILEPERDFVIIYTFDSLTKLKREIITDTPDPLDNLI
ncbi:CRISPR-associated endonuclease Cas2 [Aquifex pyrophilus]